jgi:Mg-chelatase subunit ChlD
MSDLLRFNKHSGQLFLKGANGAVQVVEPMPMINKTVFILIDASGSMTGEKFDSATKGALDFGLASIFKGYHVGVVVFSSKALATSPTNDSTLFAEKIRRLACTSGGTFLASALKFTSDHKPAYVVVVTDGMVADADTSLDIAAGLKSAGTEILTIGTDDADTAFLKQLASRSDLGIKVAATDLRQAISDTGRLLR